jgi:hypothetical protein
VNEVTDLSGGPDFDSIEDLLADVADRRAKEPYPTKVRIGPGSAITSRRIDEWLDRGQVTTASVAFSRDNSPVDLSRFSSDFTIQGRTWPFLVSADKVRALVEDGYSLVLSGPELWDIDLRRIALASVSTARVSLNTMIFVGPGNTKGFFQHRDPDDYVVVVQTQGVKMWKLYDAAPEGWSVTDTSRPADESLSREITLAVGDVLVIPRGWGHAAAAGDVMSVHLSFGLNYVSPAHFFRLALMNALGEMRESATIEETHAVYTELVESFGKSDMTDMLAEYVTAPYRDGAKKLADLP